MNHPTSVRITPEAHKALEKLKARPGGFNLSKYISAELVKLAKEER